MGSLPMADEFASLCRVAVRTAQKQLHVTSETLNIHDEDSLVNEVCLRILSSSTIRSQWDVVWVTAENVIMDILRNFKTVARLDLNLLAAPARDEDDAPAETWFSRMVPALSARESRQLSREYSLMPRDNSARVIDNASQY
jgi:hypothetical protein